MGGGGGREAGQGTVGVRAPALVLLVVLSPQALICHNSRLSLSPRSPRSPTNSDRTLPAHTRLHPDTPARPHARTPAPAPAPALAGHLHQGARRRQAHRAPQGGHGPGAARRHRGRPGAERCVWCVCVGGGECGGGGGVRVWWGEKGVCGVLCRGPPLEPLVGGPPVL